MPKKLTLREFAELMRSMPGASEAEIMTAARMKEFGDDPSLPAGVPPPPSLEQYRGPGPIPDPRTLEPKEEPSAFRRLLTGATTPLYQPALEEVGPTAAPSRGPVTGRGSSFNPEQARNNFKQAVSAVSSPADIAGLAASGGASVAGRAGLLGISRGARAVEALSNVPSMVLGGENVVNGEGLGQRVAGGIQAALGTAGAVSAGTHAFPINKVRDTYLREAGRPVARPELPAQWDEDLAKRTADAFEAMQHAPNDPQVRATYEALADEVNKQYEFVTKRAGLRTSPSDVPYENSRAMQADVVGNNRMRYFPTDSGYGDGNIGDNPLLARDANGLTVNDKFRVVHDYFGHADTGNQFGPLGERRAYLEHHSMMPEGAVPALTTETHGQNSWVNAGPHLRRADGSLPKKGEEGFVPVTERPYAAQKTGVLPKHIIDPPEGRFMDPETLPQALEDGTNYGILSAANPGEKLSAAENAARHQNLLGDVRAKYYRPLEQKGVYGGEPEPSVLVPGLTPEETKALGKKYGQEAVISNQGWHRLGDDATFSRSGPTEFDPERSDFYSELNEVTLPDGRKVRYAQQYPDSAYEPAVRESQSASPESTSRTSVEDTIQRQADQPAGTLANDEPRIELLDDTDVNGSGESAASAEAISRQRGMKARGESFAVQGPGGKIRPLIGPEAVDYQPRPNERFGKVDSSGRFTALSVVAPTAAIAMPSTGDEDTDRVIRAALLGASTAVVLKAPQVQKLVTSLPADLKVAQFIKKLGDGTYHLTDQGIKALRGWYQESAKFPEARGVWARQNELLAPAFGGNSSMQRTFNVLQAATSPQAELQQSTREALGALAAGLRNPSADEITRDMVEAEGIVMQNAGSKLPNINRAMRGEKLRSGDYIGKVQEYADLINGDPLANPPDTHHMGMFDTSGDFNVHLPELRNFFAFMEGTPAPGQRGALTPQDIYDRFKQARTRGWQEAVPGVNPSEAFADAWGARRHSLGIEDATKTPADLLIERGLGEPGALLDPDAIREALMGKQWAKPGAAGLASARHARRQRGR